MSEESSATNYLARLTKIFGSLIVTLIATGVGGIIIMAVQQSAVATTVTEIKERLTRWEGRFEKMDDRLRQVENTGRYR